MKRSIGFLLLFGLGICVFLTEIQAYSDVEGNKISAPCVEILKPDQSEPNVNTNDPSFTRMIERMHNNERRFPFQLEEVQVDKSGNLLPDSDKDGLPDSYEKTIGTNPYKKDTDGDGIIDSEDINPLAAPRRMYHLEQIMSAAFRAMVNNNPMPSSLSPIYVGFPKGIEPFELLGINQMIIPITANSARQWYPRLFRFGASNFRWTSDKMELEILNACLDQSRAIFLPRLEVSYGGDLWGGGYQVKVKYIKGYWLAIEVKQIVLF